MSTLLPFEALGCPYIRGNPQTLELLPCQLPGVWCLVFVVVVVLVLVFGVGVGVGGLGHHLNMQRSSSMGNGSSIGGTLF